MSSDAVPAKSDFLVVTSVPRKQLAKAITEAARTEARDARQELALAVATATRAATDPYVDLSAVRKALDVMVADVAAARARFITRFDLACGMFDEARELEGEDATGAEQ